MNDSDRKHNSGFQTLRVGAGLGFRDTAQGNFWRGDKMVLCLDCGGGGDKHLPKLIELVEQ